ncbi:uncharacterized protein [Gossypium hirsutum]|uniref:DNA/RNA polymerases superfamily protein n=1 Tax=Gossypium hirsutum TaxID=3635 RepID=A0A1U8NW44_GOSHI|nr:uncharacterized protein LOC107952442 [Gossypium hirsutum]
MHPGRNKLYQDLRELYWWPGLKRKVTDYVSKCLTCQQVKVEHQVPSGLLQQVMIPLWKWERVTMDFMSGLPLTPSKKDSVWVRTDYSLQKLAKLYVAEIVRLHRVPVSIISDRDPRFTSRGSWEDYLLMAEFTYNNSYQSNLKRKVIEYSVRDYVFLKVSPRKKIMRFGRKGKLSPRFIWPYRILKRVGLIAYQLEFPPELEKIHDVFHVLMLRRYRSDPSHVVPVEETEVKLDLTIEEEPVQILERDVKVLRKKSVPLVKVLWRNHGTEVATWEPEESMRHQYHHLS